jgi:hypothetical protein
MFNWDANSEESIVGPYLWIYLAVAILFTIVILGFWAIWTRFIWKRYSKEDSEARSKSLLGLIPEKDDTNESEA